DDHFAVADDVVHVALVKRVRAQRGVEVVDDVDVVRGVQAVLFAGEDAGAAQQAFGLLLAFLGQVHLLALLVDPVVALAVLFLLPGEVRDDLVDLDVQLRRVVGRAGNDQRGTRLVDQDRVDLVDDGEVEAALETVVLRQRHVVAQVVEADLVVGGVGDVGGVGRVLVLVRHARVDHADAQAQPVVQPAHPCRVAARQVVVDRDHVHALAGEGVEVGRQGPDQGLALAGAHLGDLAHVQDHAADQLHIVVAHAQDADAGLAADREGLGQDLVERFAVCDAFLELGRPGLELFVAERLHLRLERVDLLDDTAELLEQALVAAAGDAGKQTIEHCVSGWRARTGTEAKKGARRAVHGNYGLYRGGAPRGIKGDYRNLRGSTTRPRSQTSKWTWAPVERPVEPARATCWPARTR